MVGNSGNDALTIEDLNGDDDPTIENSSIPTDDISTVAEDVDDGSALVI